MILLVLIIIHLILTTFNVTQGHFTRTHTHKASKNNKKKKRDTLVTHLSLVEGETSVAGKWKPELVTYKLLWVLQVLWTPVILTCSCELNRNYILPQDIMGRYGRIYATHYWRRLCAWVCVCVLKCKIHLFSWIMQFLGRKWLFLIKFSLIFSVFRTPHSVLSDMSCINSAARSIR